MYCRSLGDCKSRCSVAGGAVFVDGVLGWKPSNVPRHWVHSRSGIYIYLLLVRQKASPLAKEERKAVMRSCLRCAPCAQPNFPGFTTPNSRNGACGPLACFEQYKLRRGGRLDEMLQRSDTKYLLGQDMIDALRQVRNRGRRDPW